jgi:hypothetical protein
MGFDKKEVLNRLIFEKILDDKNQIISEEKFKDLMFAVLVSFVAHNKILFNWNRDLKENKKMNIKEKANKIKSYFSLPFHFLGIGEKTVFVADKNPRDKFLKEEFVDTMVTCTQDIDAIRRISDLWGIEDKLIKSSHNCSADENSFCKDCKISFDNHLENNIEKLLKALDIKSYIILDIPINTIKTFIDEDDIIEEIEDMQCRRCFCSLDEHDRFCYNCGFQVEKKEKKESNDREKMFNHLLSIYLAKKKKLADYEANLHFHKGTRETDVLLMQGKQRMLLEITTQVDVPKEYITEKAISLLIMKAILPPEYKSYMIFWSLDKNNDAKHNYSNIDGMFEKDIFFLVKSSLPREILKNPTVGIILEDLIFLRKEFDNLIEYTLDKVDNLLLK